MFVAIKMVVIKELQGARHATRQKSMSEEIMVTALAE
jgi:hypothetical protein